MRRRDRGHRRVAALDPSAPGKLPTAIATNTRKAAAGAFFNYGRVKLYFWVLDRSPKVETFRLDTQELDPTTVGRYLRHACPQMAFTAHFRLAETKMISYI
jgi:hypothetical protein